MENDWICHFKNQGESKSFLRWDINVKKCRMNASPEWLGTSWLAS